MYHIKSSLLSRKRQSFFFSFSTKQFFLTFTFSESDFEITQRRHQVNSWLLSARVRIIQRKCGKLGHLSLNKRAWWMSEMILLFCKQDFCEVSGYKMSSDMHFNGVACAVLILMNLEAEFSNACFFLHNFEMQFCKKCIL